MPRFTLFASLCFFTACGQGSADAEYGAEAADQELVGTTAGTGVVAQPTATVVATRQSTGLFGSTLLCSLQLGICQQEGGSPAQCDAVYRACIESQTPSQKVR